MYIFNYKTIYYLAMNFREYEFDPTDVNVSVKDTGSQSCADCGSKNFDEFKEGDFRDIRFVKVCKDCGKKIK